VSAYLSGLSVMKGYSGQVVAAGQIRQACVMRDIESNPLAKAIILTRLLGGERVPQRLGCDKGSSGQFVVACQFGAQWVPPHNPQSRGLLTLVARLRCKIGWDSNQSNSALDG
jgi:hypothetical protein